MVELPNIKNPQRIIDLVGTTAQMLFRPVLCNAPAYSPPKGKGASPSGSLPACAAQYQLTAANLDVRPTTTSYTANTIPPDPVFASYPSTSPTVDYAEKNQEVLLPGTPSSGCSPRCVLGPAGLTGKAIASATAQFVNSQWVVDVT